MKKLLTLCLLAITMCAVAQEKKTVAVLDPVDRQQTVPGYLLSTIRMTMETAITLSSEYEAFDRSTLDKLKQEQSFQHSGEVNDNTIKKLGQLTGVNYILVPEVSGGDGYVMISAKVMDVEKGRYERAFDSEFVEMKPQEVQKAARGLAVKLFGLSGSMSTTSVSSMSSNTPTFESSNKSLTINRRLLEERGFRYPSPRRETIATLLTADGEINITCSNFDYSYIHGAKCYGYMHDDECNIDGVVMLVNDNYCYLAYIDCGTLIYPYIEYRNHGDGNFVGIQENEASYGCMFYGHWDSPSSRPMCNKITEFFGSDVVKDYFASAFLNKQISIKDLQSNFYHFLSSGGKIDVPWEGDD